MTLYTSLFCSNLKLCLPAQDVEVTKGKFQKNTDCLHGAIIISKWSNLRQICEIQNCFFEIFVYTGLLLEEDLSNQSTFELKLLSAVGVQYWSYWDSISAPGCKQNLKNETKQSGLKSDYALSQPRSGALLLLTCLTADAVEKIRWVQKSVYIIGRQSRSKKEKPEKYVKSEWFLIWQIFNAVENCELLSYLPHRFLR